MRRKIKNRYEKMERSFAPLKEAKYSAIHSITGIAKKHKWMKYPVLGVLFVFIMIYNLLYHTMLRLSVNKRVARFAALFMVACLTITSVYIPTAAVYDATLAEKTCKEHTQHDAECGYVEAIEAQPCAHEHSMECYTPVTLCCHAHDDNCYVIEKVLVCEIKEGETTENNSDSVNEQTSGHVHTDDCYEERVSLKCDHECSVESGCIVNELNCQHVHDAECGYVEAVEGHECTHVCEKCEKGSDNKPGKIIFVESGDFDKKQVVDGIEISVFAPEGVFPDGASLRVSKITNDSYIAEIEQKVAEEKDNSSDDVVNIVEQSYTFDISIIDANGNEIEPNTEYGNVEVTFKNIDVAEVEESSDKELSVYHVTDDLSEVEEISADVDASQNAASIETEHFSIYTVVITSGHKKDTILHYYQGTSKAVSYFTIYNEKQLKSYRDLLNSYISGDVTDSDTFATILVNADNANPLDGITGIGQATNMTIGDLNFNVKIMDNITVDSWTTQISKMPAGTTFDGAGHTITLNGTAGLVENAVCGVLAATVEGTISDVTIKYGANSKVIGQNTPAGTDGFATVSIRLNGEKSELGKAITGAEALAVSYDGENFLTLQRKDDYSVYQIELEKLLSFGKDDTTEPGDTPDGDENAPEVDERLWKVYYAYEDENETISAAVLSAANNYTAELNYVSVKYDLEGASTYSYKDGKLSENVMAAVRVNVQPDGSFIAQEDYEAVLKAAEGYEIPTLKKNVTVKVDNRGLDIDTDYTYSYDATKKEGTIRVLKDKITGPMTVTVKADLLEEINPANKIILKTRGGSISNPLWEKITNYTYVLNTYQNVTLPTASEINAINGSDAIRFDGWYDENDRKVTNYTYVKTSGKQVTYYAKWVLDKRRNTNNQVTYTYNGGNMDVQGYPADSTTGMTVYNNRGFYHQFSVVDKGSGPGYKETISMVSAVNSDAFVKINGTDLYVAMVYTLKDNMVNITYVFENRGSSDFTKTLYWGASADVKIAGDDYAVIRLYGEGTDNEYITMTSDTNKEFRLYAKGADQGVDSLYSYWYGGYGSASSNVFNSVTDKNFTGDSGLAFSWKMDQIIPAGECKTITTLMGMGDAASMGNKVATLYANNGKFANGSVSISEPSDRSSIIVKADGTVTVKNSKGDKVINPPTRASYKFSHWSVGAENENGKVVKEFTDTVVLYANWIPDPDRSVTNASSVKKVKGSDNLVVPATLANIVIKNNTKGASVDRILQGETIEKAAGFANGFTATLLMEGENDKYLLPDDIVVKVKGEDGREIVLTKGTGYTYSVWDNRKKADIDIRKQFITGDIIIEAVGYELPPNTASNVNAYVPSSSITYGQKAVYTANATTSKNHIATYQWYVAPYQETEIDNKVYWTYQNQDGIALTNGVLSGSALSTLNHGVSSPSGNPITVSGADKSTLRISGLDVYEFTGNPNEYGLHKGGYHVYCVITTTRNITGEQIVTTSQTLEVEVTQDRFAPPTGIEGSAPSFYGASDGSIIIENQVNRPAMQYKLLTDSQWSQVTSSQISAGKITGLRAGTYLFKYPATANSHESATTSVVVENGRYITVTYIAENCDNPLLETQVKRVEYGANFNATTPSKKTEDGTIQNPARAGYTFKGWSQDNVTSIKNNMTITAVYEPAVYAITLNNHGADADGQGASAIYEKYSVGFYKESSCTNLISGASKISLPIRAGYDFMGYFTDEQGGIQMICADGYPSENLISTRYMEPVTLHAHWNARKITFNSETDTTLTIKNTEQSSDKPSGGDVEYDPSTPYDITITKSADREANVVYVYSEGVLKKTIVNANFVNNKYTFSLIPSEVGGGNISIVVAYVSTTNEDGSSKTEEELTSDANSNAFSSEFDIAYLDVNGTRAGTSFSGTFTSAAPQKGLKGVATELPVVARTGYNFAGWYTNGLGTGSKITSIPANVRDQQYKVFAKWNANKYNITLVPGQDANIDADFVIPNQYAHDATERIALPSASQIKRENYAFKGWYETATFDGNPITEIDTSKVGDITYYAKWEILPTHTVTLPTNGLNGRVFTVESVEGYDTTVYHGMEYKFTLTMASAYGVKAVKVNSQIILPTGSGEYVVENITDDVVITVDFNRLATTELDNNAVATILLADGTTGYFSTLASAIDYATKHGTDSVVVLKSDIDDGEITIPGGRAFTLDLDGYSLGEMHILVDANADFTIDDTNDVKGTSTIEIENNGKATSNILINEVKNFGEFVNNGEVTNLLQQPNEYGQTSRFVNNGTIGTASLESGYFVENILESAPAGLTGYCTIVNGNEYYNSLQEAIDIANSADADSAIQMLQDLDNHNGALAIGNASGKKITIDMNGKSIHNAAITTSGDVAFMNENGNDYNPSSIDSTINNTGNLTIGAHIEVKRALTNENTGNVTIEDGAKITSTSPVINKGEFTNNGDISAVFNNEGNAINEGTMQNVSQQGGSFENDGAATGVSMSGGSYTAKSGAVPVEPTGAVAIDNGVPATYYGTFKDAVEAANNTKQDDLDDGQDEFKITLIKDITNLGANPVVIDSDVDVEIDLNGHNLGADDTITIQIGDGNGGTVDSTVSITNSQPDNGGVKSKIDAKNDANVEVDENAKLEGPVTNEGNFENNGTITGDFTNNGTADNNGNMTNVIQQGGSFTNENGAQVTTLTQTGGESVNEGTVNTLTQSGGQMDNKGTIADPNVSGGGFTGEGSDNANVVRTASVTENDQTKYFATLDEALEYAAGQPGAVTVKLEKDIETEHVDLSTAGDVTLDLNGHDIGTGASIKTEAGTELTIINTDSTEPKNGSVKANIENKGSILVEDEVTVSGAVDNKGTFENDGTITGVVTNNGTFANDGVVDSVNQQSGSYINTDQARTTNINLAGGSVLNRNDRQAPAPVITGGEARVGDKIYGTLEDAINAANESTTDVTIKLTGDVELATTPATVVGNENGKDITIDLNGHDISGGTLKVDNSGNSTNVNITDNSTEGDKGTISSKIEVSDNGTLEVDGNTELSGEIKNEGTLEVAEGTTVSGAVDNSGTMENNGSITGVITNNGQFTNDGTVDEIKQQGGTFVNGAGGTVEKVEQTGGNVENNGAISEAKISGGEFDGNDAGITDRADAKVATVTTVTDSEGNPVTKTTYYPTLQDAIDAIGTEGADSNVTIKLFEDINENVTVNIPGVEIDLNGHDITTPGSITISSEATDIVIKDTKTDAEGGKVNVPITNNGGLTIGSGVEAAEVNNNGTITNQGNVSSLNNRGEAVNEGEVGSLEQRGGSFKNEGNVSIAEFNAGSYEGTKPAGGLTGEVAQIGDKVYADLTSAINDANKAETNTTIKVLDDTTLPTSPAVTIGNSNGNDIVIDLNGNNVSGGTLDVKSTGAVKIDDNGSGTLGTDIKVENGATVEIGKDAALNGDIENSGNVVNKGIISGNLDNKPTGSFKNDGVDSFVGGDISNAGTVNNTGTVGGSVDNTGSLVNTGNLGDDVTNHGSGSFINSGEVSGQLTNKDGATASNDGSIHQVNQSGGNITIGENGSVNDYKQTGGKSENNGNVDKLTQSGGVSENNGAIEDLRQTGGNINNNGDIEKATVSDVTKYKGNLPDNGIPGVKASVEYTDEDGNKVIEHFTSFEDAVNAANNKAGESETAAPSITPVSDTTTITNDMVINSGVTLNVPEDKKLVVDGGSLTNNGSIVNKGDISATENGTIENNGNIDNKGGSLNGADNAAGEIVNNAGISGGTVNGPFTNKEDGTVDKVDKLSGDITNEGKITAEYNADLSDMNLTNEEGGSFGIAPKPIVPTPPSDDDDDDDDDGDDDDDEYVATPTTPVVAPLITPGGNYTGTPVTPNTNDTRNNGISIYDVTEMTEAEIADLINSSDERDKELVHKLLGEAVGVGSITFVSYLTGPAVDKAETNISVNEIGKGAIMYTSILDKDVPAIADDVLTSWEKIKIFGGIKASIRIQVEEKEKERIENTTPEYIAQCIPKDKKPISIFDVNLYKKVGDSEERIVTTDKVFGIKFEIPEKYRSKDGEAVIYEVMRIYKDEKGETKSELIKIFEEENFITMNADVYSEYVMLVDNQVSLTNVASSEKLELLMNDGLNNKSKNWFVNAGSAIKGFFVTLWERIVKLFTGNK